MSGSDPIETTIDATRRILAEIKEDASITLEIPANLTQGNLPSFAPECEIASEAPKLVIDASNVATIDDTGMKTILQVITNVSERKVPVSFDPPPSDAFLDCAARLGIEAELQLS